MVNLVNEEGIERLDVFVSQFPHGKRLKLSELRNYPNSFSAGWEIPTTLEGERVNFRILVTTDFPYKPPRIAIYPSPPVLSYPHLEEAGVLCLIADSSPCSNEKIEAVARLLLSEAVALVSACLRGDNFEEFEDEFQSYWDRCPRKTTGYHSLCAINETSRWVYTCRLSDYRLVADNKESVKKWIKDLGVNPCKFPIETIPLIHLGKPLRPSEYPKYFGDFLGLLNVNLEAMETVQRYITSDTNKQKQFLLSFESKGVISFAGLLLPIPDENLSKRITPLTRPRRKGIEQIGHGFRPHHMTFDVFMHRYASLPLYSAVVTRCDALWVHGRDQNPTVPILQSKTVVMIGAGSLGSGVIELLAKAGIGKIIIIDPETMAAENACRHTLGISSVASKKASEMKKIMVQRFPHLEFEEYAGGWEHMYGRTPQKINTADLLISTVGGWKTESQLNALARTTAGFPPVLFGWLEPHAAAAHAVVFLDKGCLRCMTDDLGIPSTPITQWAEGGTLLHVPMCGGMFQPYGAIELSHGQSLVADLAIDILMGHVTNSKHSVWIGQKKLLIAGNGKWNTEWIRKHGDIGDGGKICLFDFTANPECTICKELK